MSKWQLTHNILWCLHAGKTILIFKDRHSSPSPSPSCMTLINPVPLPGASSGNFIRYQLVRISWAAPGSLLTLVPCGGHSDQKSG